MIIQFIKYSTLINIFLYLVNNYGFGIVTGMLKNYLKICCSLLLLFSAASYARPIHIVAAENFYGDMASRLGGPYVEVVNIMQSPNQDPHLFSSNLRTAKAIADADLIIYNGLDYDHWIDNLIAANGKKNTLQVAALANKRSGDNPHIWYDPDVMVEYARELTSRLAGLDPAHTNYYQRQLEALMPKYNNLLLEIQKLKNKYHGTPVIATEPVFNYMAEHLGLKMHGHGFQISMMNDTEPSIADTKQFETDLLQHNVKVLIYNRQVTNPMTIRMQNLAKQGGVRVMGVNEMQPAGKDYIEWMEDELKNIEEK